MKQFLLKNPPDKDGAVRLEGDDYRYLVRVRRLAVGECFPALLPNGEDTLIQITAIESKTLLGKCTTSTESTIPDSAPSAPHIILFQALPKGDKMDLIVRQAAEGGITKIVPFVSEFSVAKKINAEGQKFSRWERIIKEARQQSGSKITTALRKPLQIKELFDYWKEKKDDGAVGILFHHINQNHFAESEKMLQKGLEKNSLHGYLNSGPKIVVLAIGPEGGFSDSEVSLFIENGFKPLTIGDTVLRTETAALYCAAAIRITLLERETWELKKS